MPSPSLQELPPPPSDRTGWPWTEATPLISGSDSLPKITVVTPSYNQGPFIEETIRSVLLQGYPNLDYIIIDGGSRDNSIDIIKKYEKWLAYWVSERDGGQSDALNKGFRMAKTGILGWLNSDDVYAPVALQSIAKVFVECPEIDMAYGEFDMIDERGGFLRKYPVLDFDRSVLINSYNFVGQPAAFFTKRAFEGVGGLDVSLHYSMDRDLWIKMGERFRAKRTRQTLASLRTYGACKTSTITFKGRLEKIKINRKYGGRLFSYVVYRFLRGELARILQPEKRVRRQSHGGGSLYLSSQDLPQD